MAAKENESAVAVDDEEERMRLLQQIKDSSNGPEQAKRRIELLDKMVS